MDRLYRAAAVCGVVTALGVLVVLALAYRSVPLVNAVLQTGVPVVYYGQVMVLLISCAIGVGVSLVVLYLGGGPRYRRSKRGVYGKRLFGYGGVGFFAVGAPALLMDPAAMSVGIGVIILWKILASQIAEARVAEAVEESEPVPVRQPS